MQHPFEHHLSKRKNPNPSNSESYGYSPIKLGQIVILSFTLQGMPVSMIQSSLCIMPVSMFATAFTLHQFLFHCVLSKKLLCLLVSMVENLSHFGLTLIDTINKRTSHM